MRASCRGSGLLLCLAMVSAACGGGSDRGAPVGSDGGTVVGPDGARLVVPSGSVADGTRLSIGQGGSGTPSGGVSGAVPLGAPVRFEVTSGAIVGQVTVEMGFDPSSIPASVGADPIVHLARWDEPSGQWVPVPGGFDMERGVAWASTGRLSWWRVFVRALTDIDAALTGALQGMRSFYEAAGVIASPPRCVAHPAGWEVSVRPDTRPVHVCLDTGPAEGSVLRLVNNRGYGTLLQLPEGVTVVESAAASSLAAAMWQVVFERSTSDVVYLPPTGELTLSLPHGSVSTIRSSPSDMTFGIDVLLKVLVALFPGADPDHMLPALDCAIASLSHGGATAEVGAVLAAARACLGALLPGWGAAVALVQVPLASTQRLLDQIAGLDTTISVAAPGAEVGLVLLPDGLLLPDGRHIKLGDEASQVEAVLIETLGEPNQDWGWVNYWGVDTAPWICDVRRLAFDTISIGFEDRGGPGQERTGPHFSDYWTRSEIHRGVEGLGVGSLYGEFGFGAPGFVSFPSIVSLMVPVGGSWPASMEYVFVGPIDVGDEDWWTPSSDSAVESVAGRSDRTCQGP